MEPDVQGQVETTTQETPVTDVSVREDAKTTTDDTGSGREDKSDFKTAMFEERRKRQELEQRLNDPQFIYEQAKRHGLTEEEAQAEAAASAASPTIRQPQVDISTIVDKTVASRLDYQEAIGMMPDIAKDPELKAWAAALVGDGPDRGGMSHVEAVKTIQKRLGQTAQAAKAEGAAAATTTISEKERAQTAVTTAPTNPQADEEERMHRDISNRYNPKAQEAALIEFMKKRNKR